jgi:hypothetical protein
MLLFVKFSLSILHLRPRRIGLATIFLYRNAWIRWVQEERKKRAVKTIPAAREGW